MLSRSVTASPAVTAESCWSMPVLRSEKSSRRKGIVAPVQRERIARTRRDQLTLFGYLNAGKRSLDLVGCGRAPPRQLAGADIIVVAATRSQAAELGIDPQQLLAGLCPGPSSSPSPTSAGPVRMPTGAAERVHLAGVVWPDRFPR